MNDFPVIKFTLFFSAGIVINKIIHSSVKLDFILLAILIVILIVFYLFEKRLHSLPFTTTIIFLIAMNLGYTSANIELKGKRFIPDSIYVVKHLTVYGTIEDIKLPEKKGFSFLLNADSIGAYNKFKAEIRFLCNVSDEKFSHLAESIHPGNRVKVTGTYRKGRESRNPGEFDYNGYLHSKNISGIISIYDVNDISLLSAERYQYRDLIFTARKAIDEVITDLHTIRTAALLKGLILADRSDIDHKTKTQFINAGVVHILAVSGLHTGFILLIFYALSGRFNLFLRSFLTIAGLLLFMFLTGIPASVFRASVMSIIIILAFVLNRTTNIYNSLALAALIILVINPSELFSPGFQLSFSAVLAIAFFYPVLRTYINKLHINSTSLKYILLFSAVSISAQIGTLPFTLNYFGKLSLIAVLANIIVIPLTGIIIGTVIVTLAMFPVSLWTASVYASANDFFSYLLFRIVEFTGSLKYAFLEVRNYSSTDALVFCIFMVSGFILVRYFSSLKSKAILILLIFSNIIIFSSVDDSDFLMRNKLNVYMIDVGQGDSFLIKFPDGETALIDAGNATPYFDNGERIILPLLNRLGIEKIDYGFVSHIDADHYGGFVSLIQKGKIKKIFKPRPDSTSDKDIRFERFLRAGGMDVEYYSARQIKPGNAVIFILNDNFYESGDVSSNDRSGILKIEYGNTSFLFSGDMEKTGEEYYTEKYSDFLDADVLKIGHHGSKTSTSEKFIKTTSPEISLISCGIRNKYGNPSERVIIRISNSKSRIFRTDTDGGILLQSDGNKIRKVDWRNYY